MICRTLLVITLTSIIFVSTTSIFKVNVTLGFYQAEENNNITLEWKFTTRTDKDLDHLSINCYLITDHKDSGIHPVYDYGGEVPEYLDEQFLGRVQIDKDGLKEGRIRIQISRLRTSDSGRYMCEVKTDYGHGSDTCQLNVTAADQLPTHTPTLSPHSESLGWTGLYVGAAVVLLVVFCLALFYRKIKGRQNLMMRLSERIPLRNMSGDSIQYKT